jgi:hypothetical protein
MDSKGFCNKYERLIHQSEPAAVRLVRIGVSGPERRGLRTMWDDGCMAEKSSRTAMAAHGYFS